MSCDRQDREKEKQTVRDRRTDRHTDTERKTDRERETGGCSPVWVFLCDWRWPNCEYELWQTGQTYGFSPVWVLMWTVSAFL